MRQDTSLTALNIKPSNRRLCSSHQQVSTYMILSLPATARADCTERRSQAQWAGRVHFQPPDGGGALRHSESDESISPPAVARTRRCHHAGWQHVVQRTASNGVYTQFQQYKALNRRLLVRCFSLATIQQLHL